MRIRAAFALFRRPLCFKVGCVAQPRTRLAVIGERRGRLKTSVALFRRPFLCAAPEKTA
ncbi:hypothetical protein [Kingella potus]|uniref:hypothetical protein n=1 Tax=Kingella potus TaxID=265175 RepID=UPI001FCFD61C|nr:hypothetical protein [Kingella potus]UOP00196.1 hypothetical protein LVJ84_09675 [Kingella potus]